MSLFARSVSYLGRWSNPAAALLLLGASSTISSPVQADPGDFQAMPGLWKITLHTIKDGHDTVKWKCLYDGADPWATFVDVMAPDADCQRSNEHRTSTALAWQTACGAHDGHGRIALDSPQHYLGSVKLDEQDVLKVEGQRYAACTGPAD
ncbi:DUF3617 domain-containing protein [Dyella mobilis]|uniref:Protease inhibitor Inh n=1 Tax=Dyella mobilis TaxID=1849582 RepID=A0ABS2KFY9_9GAMM|nr:hypothetical protein [Dyella mobilis]MBM7129844.1 hypothetical protein [Dyella mobilis]GLQ97892.1 hypothetical protein GCM10007863_23120 [Dyella mobilis]